jgi:hypothetical protein
MSSSDNILAIGSNDLQKRLRARLHSVRHHDRIVMMENTAVRGAGMQVDAAVKLLLLGGEAPEVSSSCA